MKAVCREQPGENLAGGYSDARAQHRSQILVKVRSAGICGSDIGAYKGVNPLITYPRIIGHEIAGEVIAVPTTKPFSLTGDRVVLEPYVYCGKCYPCSIGHTNCENLTVLGVHIDGGMAEYISIRVTSCIRRQTISPGSFCLWPNRSLFRCTRFNSPGWSNGEHVVITGCGQIGLLCALYALIVGAIPIIVDPVRERLTRAQGLGVPHAIDPVGEDSIARVFAKLPTAAWLKSSSRRPGTRAPCAIRWTTCPTLDASH